MIKSFFFFLLKVKTSANSNLGHFMSHKVCFSPNQKKKKKNKQELKKAQNIIKFEQRASIFVDHYDIVFFFFFFPKHYDIVLYSIYSQHCITSKFNCMTIFTLMVNKITC
jgi:hypothetical protein